MILSELLINSKIEYKISGNADIEVCDITFDSREAKDGVMFFCLIGSTSDGHDFAKNAYDNGCRVFALSRDIELPFDAVIVRFENTREALAYVSAAFFGNPADKMKIIGITGTKGKTSVASMISACLNKLGMPCGYIGTSGTEYAGLHFGTKNTTPESLELHRIFRDMLDAGVYTCVIEVSSQALFNFRVCGIDFYIGIFTNLSPDHIGPAEHPNFEHYKNCKKRLFGQCRHGIFNMDDDYYPDMSDGCFCSITTYSLEKEADFTAKNIVPYMIPDTLGVSFDAIIDGKRTVATLPFPGQFSVLNALAALAVCKKLGADTDKVIAALSDIRIPGRFETVPLFSDRVFVIDYAHNEISMKTLIETVRSYRPMRIVTLFGSVGDRTKNRRRELGTVCNELSDFSIITSDNPGCEDPCAIVNEIASYFGDTTKYVKIPDREEAIRYAVESSKPGDVVLLCGKGHEDYQLIGREKVPFSEKKILLQIKNSMDCHSSIPS